MLQTMPHPNGAVEAGVPSIEVRAAHAADRLGVAPDAVERLPFDLSVLDSDGVFINVDAQGFGILDRKLDWESLGISLPRNTQVAFRAPRYGLLPDDCRLPLLRPPARAHAALHKYSYHFRLVETLLESPSYRWVPWTAFQQFEAEFEAAQAALDGAKAHVLDQYDAVRAQVIDTFLRLAADSARRLQATGHLIPEGFQDRVVEGVLRVMPTPDDLEHRLVLRYRVGVLLLGSEMLAEQRQAREERRRLEQAEARLRLEQRRQEAQARLVQTELWAEEERIRRQIAVEEEERRREAAVKERLRQLKLQAARERLQDALSPLEEGAQQLHAAVYEAATALRASLQQHRTLPGGSVKRIKELSRWFRLMSWQSDEQLEQLIAELEQLAAKPKGKGKRDVGALNGVLTDIITLCYADAQALVEPSRMSALEL